jgi:hypothetical protein
MAVTVGSKIVYGVREFPEIIHLPTGKTRFRMRNNAPLMAFVRNENGTFRYLFHDCGNEWVPFLTGFNLNGSPA